MIIDAHSHVHDPADRHVRLLDEAGVLFGSGDPVLARATIERVTAPGEVRDRLLGGNLGEMIDIT